MRAIISVILFIAGLLLVDLILPVEAPAAGNTCIIKAGRQDAADTKDKT